MQFITTDQRIAVENFEVGIVYTVTFTNGDSFTGSCIGIGVDFVAFQRTAPELIFSLTMATTADVASIESLPADIGQILEYTGSLPVSIKTDGSPLLDYLITGNTIQNGTPTPENPIIPQGCGELDSGQYKIPISSASTTTPIYLGEAQTTRRIKKYEFTGQEEWTYSASGNKKRVFVTGFDRAQIAPALCSHFDNTDYVSYPDSGKFAVNASSTTQTMIFGVTDMAITSATDWTTYLAAQYAAGTPVCIWYALATETTGIVNEPLCKIGDYADTLSYAQAGVNVPTTDGLNIFDIDTAIKPSEVYLKYFSPIF